VKAREAWVLTIGDELLRGEIVDSNKSFFSERLLRLDIETSRHVTVADDAAAIREQLLAAVSRPRILLISGGLGPTRDDITTEVVARTFDRRLLRDTPTLERMRRYFASVGREMADNNAKQADFPEGAEVLENPLGTAPGFMLPVGDSLIFCTPGVPRELYRMVDHEILPRIQARLNSGRVLRARLLRTFGLGESTLDRELHDIARDDADLSLGFRTQYPDNLVRIVARGDDASAAEARLESALVAIRGRLGPTIVTESEAMLETVVAELLLEHKLRIAVAESCTGGLIAHLLTETPGSSNYLVESVVCYSNQSKIRELGVDPNTLERFEAASEPVARQLAQNIRSRSGADLGLAATGAVDASSSTTGTGHGAGSKSRAGSSNETRSSSGTAAGSGSGFVWIALATSRGTEARRYELLRDRPRNKRLAAQIALDWIRRTVRGLELPDETFPRLRAIRAGGPEQTERRP